MNIYSPSGLFGEHMGAILGLTQTVPTLLQAVAGEVFAASRLQAVATAPRRALLPTEPAYLISVDLAGGLIELRDLRSQAELTIGSTFDLVQLYLPCAALEQHALRSQRRFSGLRIDPGRAFTDPVIFNLTQCLLPHFGNRRVASQFIEGLVLALYAHLLGAYSVDPASFPAKGGLAPWQHRRAAELLAADLTRPVRIAEVATGCKLSVSHFGRAFRSTEGISPHQWLIRRRVDEAKRLLGEGGASLAQVAMECGFSDQSHFTRAFSRLTGSSPGQWRRQTRAA